MEIKEIITFVVIVLVVVIVVYLPRREQEKHLRKMQGELKVGDNVVSYSGFSGCIVQVLEDRVVIEMEPDHVRVSLEKWAIAGLNEES